MKNVLITAIFLLFAGVGFSQTPCGALPVAMPDEKPKCDNAQAFFVENLPESIGDDETTHGVFKALIDCDGNVTSVFYTQGELSDEQSADLIEVIKDMEYVAAQKDGDAVKAYSFISLKISSGAPTCAVN